MEFGLLYFLTPDTDLSTALVSSYDYSLVLLSIVVACLASYTALQISERVHFRRDENAMWLWIVAGSIVMGCGIFSMHFLGMLAFQLPIPVTYNLSLTLLSILPAILTSGCALYFLVETKLNLYKLNLAGLVMGLGIGTMHYTGMFAMHINAHMAFDPVLFGLSIIVAHILATFALYIQFLVRQKIKISNFWSHIGASLVMGCSASGMHYTGMAAAYYFPADIHQTRISDVDTSTLVMLLVAINLIILTISIVSTIVDRHIRRLMLAKKEIEAYASLPDANPGPIVKIDSKHNIILANSHAAKIFHQPDLMNTSIFKLLPQLDSKFFESLSDHLDFLTKEIVIDGTTYLFQFIKIAKRQEVNIYGTDITGIKQLEKQLADQKQSLDIAALVSETDLQGNIIYVNQRFCQISQYSPEELLGQNHRMVNSGKHPKEFWKNMWHTLGRGQIWKGEICNKAKDGTFYWVESTIIPVRNQQGEIIKYSSVRIDTSEKKESEVMLLHSAKLASIGELAAGVGHEINNPLAIIIGNLQKLKKEIMQKGLLDPSIELSIAKQEDGLQRIAAIVDGLRTYSRMNDDYEQVLDTHELLSKTIILVSSMYKESGIKLTTDLRAQDFIIKGNIGKFQQVLMILLSNAKDAIEKSQHPSISIVSESTKSELVISIIDNGCGIVDEVKDKIFETFYTTKKIGKGTGIGLGVLAKIVHDMNGKVEFESRPGVGSTFSLYFSLLHSFNKDNAAERRLPLEQKKLNGTALVVDDEADIREILIDFLSGFGLKVDEAADGLTALEMIKNKNYDYVCTDMKMPKMTGDQLISEAKKLANGNGKYFIITGGIIPDMTDKGKGLVEGAPDGYITKPFSEESIYQALSS